MILLFQEMGQYLIRTFFQLLPFAFLAIAGVCWWIIQELKDRDDNQNH